MKREALSFITLILVGLSTVLAILLINEKRQALTTSVQDTAAMQTSVTSTTKMSYEMPAMVTLLETIALPAPNTDGSLSVESAIKNRRSKRVFSQEPVTLTQLSQVLWAAQGITDDTGHRAAPSAKSAYPYTLYVIVKNVEGLEEGLYYYNPVTQTLGDIGTRNIQQRLIDAKVQANSQDAPVVIALVAAPAKMLEKFPDADPMENVYLEGGHIGQNIYLQAESLGMATVVTGGFDSTAVLTALDLDTENEVVVYLVPFGHIGEAPAEEAAH